MNDPLDIRAQALAFCAQHPGADLATVEAAMKHGAQLAAEHGVKVLREERRELALERARANAPQ